MLRKILTILVVIGLAVTFGCKKAAPPPKQVTIPEVQKQVEGAGQKAAKEAEAAKEKAREGNPERR